MSSLSPLFTVVIPACDVGAYISDAIESLKKQEFRDFSVLLINEDSHDDTAAMAAAAIAGDTRFQVINMPRSGSASVSRNYGIEHANGEYLIFLDGDDSLSENALKMLAQKLDFYRQKGEKLDMLLAAARTFYQQPSGTTIPGDKIFNGTGTTDGATYSGSEFMQKICPPSQLRQATWMRIYSADFLRKFALYQLPGCRHQDCEWTPRVFWYARKLAVYDFEYYRYRKRPGSVTTCAVSKSIYDEARVIGSLWQFYRTTEKEMPERLRRLYATYFADYLNSFFSPAKRATFTRRDRARAFRTLLVDFAGFLAYLSMLSKADFGKKMMLPGVTAAMTGYWGFCLAEYYFRLIYYPLLFGLWGRISRRRKG